MGEKYTPDITVFVGMTDLRTGLDSLNPCNQPEPRIVIPLISAIVINMKVALHAAFDCPPKARIFSSALSPELPNPPR